MAQLKLKESGSYNAISPDFVVTVNQMPPVTSADNDKFARVVNGEWQAATIFQAEDTNNYNQSIYLMGTSSFVALNNLANTHAGTTGNHTLTEIITLLST